MSAELRKKVKEFIHEGTSLTEVLHPYTQVETPNTLISATYFQEQAALGNYEAILVGDDPNNLYGQVMQDLSNAEAIYKAFDIAVGDTAALQTAVSAYTPALILRKDANDYFKLIIENTVLMLKVLSLTDEQLSNRYELKNPDLTRVTLDQIAAYLAITPETGWAAIDYAIAINSALNEL